jgi:hypothetical protein
MKTTQGYTTIDNLIREIILNEGRTTLHKYLWYLSYALKAHRQFAIDDSKEFKTKKLVMDNKRAVRFPDDLIQWNKIGLMFKDRVEVIVPDETIALFHEKEGSVYQPNDPWISDEVWDIPFHNYYNAEGRRQNMFLRGKAYNRVGYYRLNEACREIQFSADLDKCSVYIEYVGNCSSPCNKTFVPVIAMDMIQEAIQYYDKKFRHGEADKRTIDQFNVWDRERMRYKGRISDLSEDGLRNVNFRNTHVFFKI